jgi:hypothetical protein
MPYVSSVTLDLHYQAPNPIKNPARRYYFRGNMHRWHGERHFLPDLAGHLTGADFAEVSFVASGKPKNFEPILRRTAEELRESNMCPSPEGDTPTSLRLFEALSAGCVPIVIGVANLTTYTLPFPSLIKYDEIALFSRPFSDITTQRRDGLKVLAAILEEYVGPNATEEKKRKLEDMRARGLRVYDTYFSFFRNPNGVATSMLFEAWVLLQKHGIITGPLS